MFKFAAFGVDKLLDQLNKLHSKYQDKRSISNQIANIEKQDIRTRIGVSKVAPDGTPWAPWKQSTLIYRTNKGNVNRGLLFDSGRLLNSIEIFQTDSSFAVGTSLSYAPYLNNGTDKMPGRKFMGLSQQAKDQIEKILQSHIGLPKV